ncbi:hypothetical protein PRIPAC_75256 [Pristionchus pacificus]|uniref:G protein-coupled receptor n=1 Tax=Pristionchus pacificus TaxID=54126 RepID=A0A2A6C8R8_PRIPA|nr:hypothetical protein PRIPAC_75256 [Pristionchus pacificus]|eukprot:PDM74507.1 G protein-coupled receptor [Pristionchus pacificus]
MKPIPQLRCNLFMTTAEEYDCSVNGTWAIDWPTRGTVRPYFGSYCLLYSCITIPLYLMSAQVIWTMRRAATYKILFLLAVSDIMALVVCSFFFGIFLIMYYNVAHIFNNTMMPLFSCIAYVIMLLYLLFKGKTSNNQNNSNALNRAAALLSIQSGIIVVVHSTTGVTYMLFQYVTPTDAFLYIAQISWQLLHGIPPFVYLVFNPSLRDGVKQHASPVRSSFMMMPTSITPKSTLGPASQFPPVSQSQITEQ